MTIGRTPVGRVPLPCGDDGPRTGSNRHNSHGSLLAVAVPVKVMPVTGSSVPPAVPGAV